MSGIWRHLKKMQPQKSELLFHLDTEFAGPFLIEIGIENAAGTEVINTLVTYDKPWRQIYAEGGVNTKQWMDRQKSKFKWNYKWEFAAETKTINALEVANCLKNARTHHPDARFLEFSRGNQYLKRVHDFLDSGDTNLGGVLGGHVGIGLIPEWQRKLLGFWYFAQDLLFKMIHPDHPLSSDAHRALLDAKKIHILFKDLVDDSAQN